MNTDQTQKRALIGSLFVVLAGMLWGITGTFVRYFNGLGLDTWQVTLFKVGFAGILFFLYAVLFQRDALKIKLKDIWIFIGSGVISLTFFTWAYFSTIEATSISTAAVLLYASPVIVMVLSAILFKESITRRKIIACILAFCGCFFVSGIIGSGQSIPVSALITGILSACGYGLYSIFSNIAMNKGYSSLTVTTYTFLFATLSCLFFFRPSQIKEAVIAGGSPVKFWLIALLMSVIVSLAPYTFFTLGLERVGAPGKAAIMASVEPVMATIVGMIAFHEFPDVFGYIGIALVVSAIVLLNLTPKTKVKEKTDIE